jgi:hypothetical protein
LDWYGDPCWAAASAFHHHHHSTACRSLHPSSDPSLHHPHPPVTTGALAQVSSPPLVFFSEVSIIVRNLNLQTFAVVVKPWSYYVQQNPYLQFLLSAMDLNNEWRKILRGGNLTLRLLTWGYWNCSGVASKCEHFTYMNSIIARPTPFPKVCVNLYVVPLSDHKQECKSSEYPGWMASSGLLYHFFSLSFFCLCIFITKNKITLYFACTIYTALYTLHTYRLEFIYRSMYFMDSLRDFQG